MTSLGVIKVLFIEASQEMVERATSIMRADNLQFEYKVVATPSALAAALKEFRPNVIIPDSRMGLKSSSDSPLNPALHPAYTSCEDELFEDFLEKTKEIVFVTNRKTLEIEKVSKAATEFFVKSAEELIGRKVTDLGYFYEASPPNDPLNADSLQRRHSVVSKDSSCDEVDDIENPAFLVPKRSRILLCSFVHDLNEKSLNEERLRMLALEITKTEEREKRRFASYLHDEIGQNLAMLKMRLDLASHLHPMPGLGDEFRQIAELLDRTMAQTRAMVFDLSPPTLYELGLSNALRYEGETICRENQIEFIFFAERIPLLSDDKGILIFRCLQELMRNCLRHAKASRMELSLRGDGKNISICLNDDGIGFDVSCLENGGVGGGFGLFSVRERIRGIGGALTIISRKGEGTRIDLAAPIS
ncbi:MAG TPA: sensor histidine kinase [Rectinemataceae bacterium]|nr:sensor histidine kinase [Rectinemataceae bacterium]